MIRIKYGVDCGGMLRVIAEEMAVLIVIPLLSMFAETGKPFAFSIIVRGPTTSLMVCSFLPLPFRLV